MAGIGQYWTLVEMCAEKLEKGGETEFRAEHCVFSFERGHLANELGIKSKRSENILGTFQEHSLIQLECSENVITIKMPKLLEILDRDSRRARHDRATTAPKRKKKKKIKDKEGDGIPAAAPSLVDIWNLNCGDLPKVREVGKERQDSIRARLADCPDLETWTEVVKRIAASDFCNGRVEGKTWKASFDFLLRPKTRIKALEGAYDNHNTTGSTAIDWSKVFDESGGAA